jgi:hypothetical protein
MTGSAKQSISPSKERKKEWIASSLSLLAMTRMELSFRSRLADARRFDDDTVKQE